MATCAPTGGSDLAGGLELLTRRAAAAMVGVNPVTVTRLVRRGEFPAPVTVPGVHGPRYRRTDVAAWLEQARRLAGGHPTATAGPGAAAGDLDQLRALLADADAALSDLGACNDPRCAETACLQVRQRIAAVLGRKG
jgi:predicted DNA-binding transcriptional regulator AlpA